MATTTFKKLAGLLPDTYSQGRTAKVSMVVYIDEAHTLDQMGKRSGPSMFDHMLKATADLWDIPVFFSLPLNSLSTRGYGESTGPFKLCQIPKGCQACCPIHGDAI